MFCCYTNEMKYGLKYKREKNVYKEEKKEGKPHTPEKILENTFFYYFIFFFSNSFIFSILHFSFILYIINVRN